MKAVGGMNVWVREELLLVSISVTVYLKIIICVSLQFPRSHYIQSHSHTERAS